MKRTLHALSIVFCLSSAQAVKANVYSVEIAPEKQLLIANYEVETGFPNGKQTGTAQLDCSEGTAPEIDAWKEVKLDTYEKFPEGTQAILASKAVEATKTAVTLHAMNGDLRFYCEKGTLYTDFTAIAANPKLSGNISSTASAFDVEQTFTNSLYISYPLVSGTGPNGTLASRGITLLST